MPYPRTRYVFDPGDRLYRTDQHGPAPAEIAAQLNISPFGYLTVESVETKPGFIGSVVTGFITLRCVCSNLVRLNRGTLRCALLHATTTAYSCGCRSAELLALQKQEGTLVPQGRKPVNLTGQSRGRLTVTSHDSTYGWVCQCTCGAIEYYLTGAAVRYAGARKCRHGSAGVGG